ncbi:hypothetical protein LWI29_004132 [Acer saccharum]|uniref:Pentatricopeptide repeat-containing protein n=1 Tax=Acer saccharum TaxID=4024 RepID=A0AA39RGW7_ACESA|nr:hypothetical protein LWI29_004132 [Acer saccharum]
MLNKLNSLHLRINRQILFPASSLIFSNSTVSAAKLDSHEPTVITTSISPIDPNPSDPVRDIVADLKNLGFRRFIGENYVRDFDDLRLNESQVDRIFDCLRTESPVVAVQLFHWLRSEYGFKHSRYSSFVVSHVLASKKRFKELRFVLEQMLQEEGSDSAPSLCELLLNSFRDWGSNSEVCDMLAFVYSRSEMVHDALFVLAKMKDLNLKVSIQTYNSLLYNLRYTDIVWDLYHEIKVNATPQSEYTTSILIDGLCQQSRVQNAVLFLQETAGEEFGPSVVSFNTIMSRCCKLGFAEAAKALVCMMLKYGLHPDAYSYNILIHGLCVAGSMEEALEFTNDMQKHGVKPDTLTYHILAKGFHLLGQMTGAWEIIQKMLVKGLNPDLVTYTALICGHCQIGNIEEGLRLREEMLSQGIPLNAISYSVLLSCLCKRGQVDEALRLFYEMETAGLNADLVTYSILIHGLCKQEKVQKAIQLYDEMCSKKIYPNSFTLSAILLGLCENEMMSEARMYFDTLTMCDLTQDIILYNIMIDGYVKVGNIGEALQLYNQIIEKRITPSIVTFNSLIYGLCKNGMVAEARRWLLENIMLHGLEPSTVTYTILMNAYCEEGNMHCLFKLLEEMRAKAIGPSHITYTVVIKGLCKQWKLQEAIRLLEDMYAEGLTPDQITYNTIIQCFCKAKDIKTAFQLHEEMLLHKLEPTPVTYNILINGLCLYGDLKDADNLLFSLQKSDISLTKVAYTTIIKAHCVKGDVNKAVVYFRHMVEKGFEISIRDYSSVINRLCKRCLISEAKSFFRMMLLDGYRPDQHICEVICNAVYQGGDISSMFELAAGMIKSGLVPDKFMRKKGNSAATKFSMNVFCVLFYSLRRSSTSPLLQLRPLLPRPCCNAAASSSLNIIIVFINFSLLCLVLTLIIGNFKTTLIHHTLMCNSVVLFHLKTRRLVALWQRKTPNSIFRNSCAERW